MPSTHDHSVVCRMLVVLSFLTLGLGGVSSKSADTMTSQNCSSVVEMVLTSAYSGVGWAVEMVDACAKPAVGILELRNPHPDPMQLIPFGARQFLGNYDQCLGVKTSKDFATSYCRADLQVKRLGLKTLSYPRRFLADICVPDICSGKDLVPVLQNYAKKFPHVDIDVSDVTCLRTEFPLSNKAIVAICVLSVLLFLVTVGTIYDVVYIQDVLAVFKKEATSSSSGTEMSSNGPNGSSVGQDANGAKTEKVTESHSLKPGTIGQVLVSFSLYTNIPNMFSTSQSKGSITCVNGIRVICVFWVAIGHLFLHLEAMMDNAGKYFETNVTEWSLKPILVFGLAVDTLFLLSGLLSAHKTLKELQKEGPSLQYFKRFYLHRYWRLTPPVLLSALTYIALFKYISNGPLWFQGDVEINDCNHNWWKLPLYMTSELQETCFGHTWSLFFDMKYYIISPVVLLALFYFNWSALLIPLGIVVAGSVYGISVSWKHKLPIDLAFELNLLPYVNFYYINVFTRMGPYFIGTMTGYILYKTDCKAKLSKWFVTVGWMVSIALLYGVVAVLFGHHRGEPVSDEMSALYNGLHRIAFTAALSWVIFACASGYGGIINRILSWNFFVPLTRFSYLIYLLHLAVVLYFVRSQRRFLYINWMTIIFVSTSVVVIATVVAGIAYLFFEVPFANLEKVIRNNKNDNKTKVHQN